MPSVTKTIAVSADDYHSNDSGLLTSSFEFVTVNDASTNGLNFWGGFRFATLNIPRYAKIDSAVLTLRLNEAPQVGSTIVAALESGTNPAASTTVSDMRARVLTNAKINWSFATANGLGNYSSPDLKASVQEQVNKADMTALIIQLRPNAISAAFANNRLRFHLFDNTSLVRPQLVITYTLDVTASATFRQPAPRLIATAEVSQNVTASATFRQPAPRLVATAEAGTPAPRTGGGTFTQPAPRLAIFGVVVDPKVNIPYAVELPYPHTHHLITEAGEVLGCAATFEATLSVPRDGTLGSDDSAWYPEAGLRNRVPAPIRFRAHVGSALAGDRLERLLPEVRQLVLPDGRVHAAYHGDMVSRPHPHALEVVVQPAAARPRHPLLSGSLTAAFATVSSTPELPMVAIDPAGGITAPLLTTAERGTLFFAPNLDRRTLQGLASVGRPVEGDGTAHASSVAVSYAGDYLTLHLRGIERRVRELDLGGIYAPWAFALTWTPYSAHLSVYTSRGADSYDFPIGPVTALSEHVLTARVRADGVGMGGAMALGSAALLAAFYTPLSVSPARAAEMARNLYAELAGKDWTAQLPELGLTLTRAGTLNRELAPGESLTFDVAAERTGGYTGSLNAVATVGDGLTATVAEVSTTGAVTLFRITLTAPAATPEASYIFRVSAQAPGADAEGSLLTTVRAALDGIVEVAAGPAIMPNATAVRYADDPT